MRKCPYCAEQVQDEAIVCRFCNRDLPPAEPRPRPVVTNQMTVRGIAVLLGIFALSIMIAYVFSDKAPRAAAADGEPSKVLDISGARNSLGIIITNRESETISDCVIAILERGRSDQWYAAVQKLGPTQSEGIYWSRFVGAGGARMAGYIGQSARYATVECGSHKSTRQGAGLSFQ